MIYGAPRHACFNLGQIAGAAASFIPGVGPIVAPLVSGAVNDLDGQGGGGSSSSGGTGASIGNALTNGLSAAEAAQLSQQLATGDASQVAGLESTAKSGVNSNTTNAENTFANLAKSLGTSPALAAGVKNAQLTSPALISGVGSNASVSGGGVTSAVAPTAPDYADVLSSAAATPSAGTSSAAATPTTGNFPTLGMTSGTTDPNVGSYDGVPIDAIWSSGNSSNGTGQNFTLPQFGSGASGGYDPGDGYDVNLDSSDPADATNWYSTLAAALSAAKAPDPASTSSSGTAGTGGGARAAA